MEYLNTLNPQQRAAVTAPDGPVLVLAGPGSGKTRVLTRRIAHLIHQHNIKPYQIVAVTFTNKAAGEMRERVKRLVPAQVRGLRIGTFHALCARLLRSEANDQPDGVLGPFDRSYLIYDTSDQRTVVKQAVDDIGVNLKRLKLNEYAVLNRISDAKNELVSPAQYPKSSYEDEVIARLYEQYQIRLRNSNAMDFDDLIMHTVLLLRQDAAVRENYQRWFEYVLVDEFQDTNTAQYELVRLWGKPQQNVFVVGDEDQAIYGFRGADYRNVARFRRDYRGAQTILLEQNYRSTQVILDAARAVIDHNSDRTPKKLFTERTDRANIFIYEAFDENEEAEFVVKEIERLRAAGKSYEEIAVMYRTNNQSRALEEALARYGLPYRLIGGTAFYQRREIKDMLAYLRLLNSQNDLVSFNRVINTPRRGIGAKTQAAFEQWATDQQRTYNDALIALVEGEEIPGLNAGGNRKLADFGIMLAGWQRDADNLPYPDLLQKIIDQTGYEAHLATLCKDDDELHDRRDNLKELRGRLKSPDFETLTDFLTNAALATSVDESATDDAVTLLTLHASKGLEYDVVFLTGLEDGLLPHMRAIDEPDGIQEERRLLYVGITRARDQLYITRAFRRRFGGYTEPLGPSRFLYDLPSHLLDGGDSSTNQRRAISDYEQSMMWNPDADDFLRAARKARYGDPEDKIVSFPGAQSPQYRSGMQVEHSKFGKGIVIESHPAGEDEQVTVAFEQVGIKQLMASFAKLNILDD